MKRPTIKPTISAVALLVICGVTWAQTPSQRTDFGKREFETNCATCHGTSGKGNGPIVDLLKRSPPDLTQLAKKNQGVFPMDRLYEVIEGANVPSHGSRDMPIWGRDYRIKDAEYYMDTPYNADALVRGRILALLEYINRLQVR
ncbi:MAG: c-type cytochrome [Burkholderiaceae bacterium]